MDTELLTCIFTGDYIEDPVTTPVCGHTFSRSGLQNYKIVKGDDFDCPICRTSLDDFDIDNAPKNILIANLIDSMKSQNLPPPNISVSGSPVWGANLYRLKNISCIELESNISINQNKCLLIPVIDKSGSMSGNPMTQVNYSVKRAIDQTKNSQNLITHLITYDDNYKIYDMSQASNINIIAGGGTNFRNAFKGLYEVLKKYKDDNFVSECVIIFLTDGQDCSGDRTKLPSELKEELLKVWKKSITIHTIGFSSQHDFTLLDNLRKCGTIEGAYRYADPTENLDSLSAKLNGVFDAVSTNINTKIEVEFPEDVKILNFNKNIESNKIECKMICDVNLNDKISKARLYLHTAQSEFEIKVNLGNIQNTIFVKMEINSIKENELWSEWIDISIDQISSELIEFKEMKENALYKGLLLQRLKSIKKNICTESQSERIDILWNILKNSNTIDTKKLIDMKYESQFKTKFDKPVVSNSNQMIQSIPIQNQNQNQNSIQNVNFKPYVFRKIKNYQGGVSQLKLMSTTVSKIDFLQITNEKDKIGNNCLHMMSMNGRYHTIKKLLELNIFDINQLNNYNETALDLAALYGHTGTYKLLRENGAKHNLNGDMLLYTALMKSKGEYRTATVLLENKVSTLCPAFLAKAPSKESFNWMLKTQAEFMDTTDKFHAGLSNVNLKAVQTALEEDPTLKFDILKYFNLFETKTIESARIVDLLINKKLLDPDCTFLTSNELTSDEEDKITFPLFKACGCGNITLVNILLKYLTEEQVNRQNNMGATALWIASCNGHLDIVLSLLQKGAKSNIQNLKGDSPLIPACQKGYVSVVEALIEAGASLDCYNKNRDNPIIICCRTGQNKVLEVLLKTLSKENLDFILNDMTNAAQIDGFNPILAAAEVNKVECINVLHSFGANINIKTSNDNPIIKGATPLHLASHYNRFAAVKILLELNADINALTADNSSSLHIAVKGKYLDIADYLLKMGINQKLRDSEGNMAEFYADKKLLNELFTEPITNQLLELIKSTDKEFISKGCDILLNKTNSYGFYEYSDLVNHNMGNGITPLTLAIQSKNTQLMDLLNRMGADQYKMDSNGFTPRFWAHCLNTNGSSELNNFNEIELERLYKLKQIQKKNIQYKMLTTYDKVYGNSVMNSGTILDKMNLGNLPNVNEEIMENLEIAEFCEQSLVGFLDKFKNTQMYNDAKIKLIELLTTVQSELNPVQILSLYLWTYSEEIYKTVYDILSNRIQSNQIYESYIYTFYSALKNLPPHEGEVYRALEYSENINFSKENYPIGGIIKWNSFSSTSSDWKFIAPYTTEKKGIIFIIHSKSGRLIKHFSRNQNDNEVVFLPNKQFKINYYYRANLVCLGQENIRKTTYTFSDTDIEKAQNKKLSVVIELTEI